MQRLRRLVVILVIPSTVLAGYVLSILWRGGFVEQELFGRSYLPPASFAVHPRDYLESPTPDSFGNTTYSFVRRGKTIHVYKQLINSFQHVYGSALATYELGAVLSDVLFRANEYAESLVCRNSGSDYFYLDTKKDLANNAIGREIGVKARQEGLFGAEADRFMVDDILTAIDNSQIYNHFQEQRVAQLPSFREYGCPLLLEIQEWRRGNKMVTVK